MTTPGAVAASEEMESKQDTSVEVVQDTKSGEIPQSKEAFANFIKDLVSESVKGALSDRGERELQEKAIAKAMGSEGRAVAEVAKNGPNDEIEREELVSEFFRHKWLGSSYLKFGTPSIPREQVERALHGELKNLPFSVRKTLDTATSSAGAEFVATQFMSDAIVALENITQFREVIRVFPNVGNNKLDWPKVSAKPSASYTTERSGISTSDVDSTNVTLTARNCKALTEAISKEVVADARFPLIQMVSGLLREAQDLKHQEAFAIGNSGATPAEPKGIYSCSFTSVAQAGATLALNDLVALYHALPQQYRSQRAVFITNGAGIEAMSRVKTSQNEPLLIRPMDSAYAMFAGRRVLELPDLPGTAATAGSTVNIYFGDFTVGYYWADFLPALRVESTDQGTNFTNDTIQIKSVTRNDGNCAQTAAVRVLTGVIKP